MNGQLNILKESLKELLIEPGAKMLSFDLKPLSDKRQGFLGDHFTLVIKYDRTNGEKTLKLFIKSLISTPESIQSYEKDFNAYKKELFFYDIFCKELQKAGCDVSFAPVCYACNQTTFALEDLATKGFKMLPLKTFFDYEQSKALLTSLAKMHAGSIVCEELKPAPFRFWDEHSDVLTNFMLGQDETSNIWKWVKAYEKPLLALLDQDETIFRASFRKRLVQTLDDFLKPSSPNMSYRNVIVHGDLWSNNIMFKGEGAATKCLLVDYQLLFHGNQFYDVFCAMFSNMEPKFMRQNLKRLIKDYMEVFRGEIDAKGLDSQQILPSKTVSKLCRETMAHALVRSGLTSIFIHLPPIPNFEPSLEKVLNGEMNILVQDSVKTNPGYRDFLVAHLKLFDDILHNELDVEVAT